MVNNTSVDLNSLLAQLSCCQEADVFLYSGDIALHHADALVMQVNAMPVRNKNAALILTTYGGSPDAGYRIARLLKKKYQKFILYVFGYCKSAGTLVAVGANEIVMSEYGELGPLDMQVTKEDELRSTSTLDYLQALISLKGQAFNMFEEFFLSLKRNSGSSITTKTAASIATSLTTGILAPIAEQIDPLRIGEVQRTLNMSYDYGRRLTENNEMLFSLISDYPSHGFVIDYKEAKELFKNVREPDEIEQHIADLLHRLVRAPATPDIVQCIYPLAKQENTNETQSECYGDGDAGAVEDSISNNPTDEQVVSDNSSEVNAIV